MTAQTINLNMKNIFYKLINYFKATPVISPILPHYAKNNIHSLGNDSEEKYMQAGLFKINANTARFFTVMGGLASAARYLDGNHDKDTAKVQASLVEQAEAAKKNLEEMSESYGNLKVKVLSQMDEVKNQLMESQINRSKEQKYLDILANKKEPMFSEESLEELAKGFHTKAEQHDIQAKDIVQKIINDLDISNINNNFISMPWFDPNYWSSKLDSLSHDQLGALANLLFSQVILASVISIVFIFYGDFLITKYNLESRYPKLAKFIQLRRKFQQYYLLVNVGWILAILAIELYIDMAILLK